MSSTQPPPLGGPSDYLADPDYPLVVEGRPPWQPTYKDVAGHLVNFTRDGLSRQTYVFGENTAITADEVARCIYAATDEVDIYCGRIPDIALAAARDTAAICAAGNAVRDLDLQLSEALLSDYKERLERLSKGVAREKRRGEDGELPACGVKPPAMHTFPESTGPKGIWY